MFIINDTQIVLPNSLLTVLIRIIASQSACCSVCCSSVISLHSVAACSLFARAEGACGRLSSKSRSVSATILHIIQHLAWHSYLGPGEYV